MNTFNGGNGGDNADNNGGARVCNTFGRQSVKYPVKFDLKAIIDAAIPAEDSIKALEKVLSDNGVPFSDWRQKESSGGKYLSYTVSVDIANQQMLEKLYKDLKTVPGLKFAL